MCVVKRFEAIASANVQAFNQKLQAERNAAEDRLTELRDITFELLQPFGEVRTREDRLTVCLISLVVLSAHSQCRPGSGMPIFDIRLG